MGATAGTLVLWPPYGWSIEQGKPESLPPATRCVNGGRQSPSLPPLGLRRHREAARPPAEQPLAGQLDDTGRARCMTDYGAAGMPAG